ncbi:DUF3139 domain-containing protein [Clostridium cylindrosporum]|uniref:DUF4830 domain-containing protein n=1 Tax=Clostridium cylindrosporum DSM 605 TaxID=1121307 RepID=A0A0J8D9P1_CLOCY|nr:DUF3139 domain-containing protein [Clostridium cylindrosporum]KMT22562.1 hypothetical protein CLCY_10c01090 [Clostridium cylindrosporum DSM 605]
MNIKIKKSILILSIAAILIAIVYVQINTKKIYNMTEKHLIENRGYKKSDISKIEVKYYFINRILSYEEWIISVVFKDEPKVKYSYSYRDNKISQGGASGRLDDGIYDHSESPGYKNMIVAGNYIKKHGYTIFKLFAEVDRYKLDGSMFKNTKDNIKYKQVWSVQGVKPDHYFGKEVVVMGFKVRNHPLQKRDINAKEGVNLYVMIVDGKAIGGYSLPTLDTVGGFYSIDGKTAEELKSGNIKPVL